MNNFRHTSSIAQKVCSSTFGAATAVGILMAGHAQALVIAVGLDQWSVTTFTGSYNDNIGLFNPTYMPWWGNDNLAKDFATALGSQILTPNFGYLFGPTFAFADTLQTSDPSDPVGYPAGALVTDGWLYCADPVGSCQPGPQGEIGHGSYFTYDQDSAGDGGYAKAVHVPGPLPFLGAGAAFGWSRRLRRRIASPLKRSSKT